MGWKDDLSEASFKGVPFFVEKIEDEFGRRIVHNEFPGRDIGTVQDLGKKDEIYTVTGFLLGDYAKNLEQLEDATRAVQPSRIYPQTPPPTKSNGVSAEMRALWEETDRHPTEHLKRP